MLSGDILLPKNVTDYRPQTSYKTRKLSTKMYLTGKYEDFETTSAKKLRQLEGLGDMNSSIVHLRAASAVSRA